MPEDDFEDRWRQWELHDWNAALVNAIFSRQPKTSAEILRIDATPGLLVNASKASPEEKDEVRRSFLNCFPRTSWRLNSLFDASTQIGGWNSKSDQLPFFSQLYLTILVASADEDTFEIGNFRHRLRTLLNLNFEAGHIVNDLPRLWHSAARWSRNTRRPNTRRLMLPDPGHETIIGHSKRLAFPGFSDQTRLASLLAEQQLDSDSPQQQIVRFIGRNRSRFSSRFGEEFDLFLHLLKDGDTVGAARSPFWGAIVEVSWGSTSRKPQKNDIEFQLELDPGDPYSASLMLLSNEDCKLEDNWACEELAFPVDEMKFEIRDNSTSTGMSLDGLLSKAGARLVERHQVGEWIQRGWIGFARSDTERWLASADLSRSDKLWLLLRDDRWSRLASALRIERRTVDYTVEGVLSHDWALVGPFKNNPGVRELLSLSLNDKASFEARLRPPQIRITNALRLPEGILLVPTCSPSIAAPWAERISWHLQPLAEDQEPSLLRESSDAPGTFILDDSDLERLPSSGTIEFRALDDGNEEIDRASVRFVNGCVSRELKRPKDASAFLRSGEFGQLTSIGPTISGSSLARSKTEIKFEIRPISYFEKDLVSTKAIEIDEMPTSWVRCLEILTAVFVQRACVPTQDFVDLISKIWSVSKGVAWSRIEDLVENGFIEHFQHRRWRGSVIVGQPLRYFASKSGTSIRIVGLAPMSAYRALAQAATSRGGRFRVFAADDLSLIGASEMVLSSAQLAMSIVTEFGILPIELPSLSPFQFPSWRKLLSTEAEVPPNSLSESWCKKQLRFRPSSEMELAQDRLEKWELERAQPLYQITCKHGKWTTRSRTWALLAYYSVCPDSRIGFVNSNGSCVLEPRLILPNLFSRSTLIEGGGICLRDLGGSRIYPASRTANTLSMLENWIVNKRPVITRSTRALERYHAALSRRRRSMAFDTVAGESLR